MTVTPLVSVVMSVFNGADGLSRTVDSILGQAGADLEFVVVDDGSTDQTAAILQEYASKDPRICVVQQQHTGLTRALVAGCRRTRGKYIARQDAGGDLSLPDRLSRQVYLLESNPSVVMTSCGTRFIGPDGEKLFEITQSGGDLHDGLTDPSMTRPMGPSHHGSTLFRRSVYENVGGYRPAFQVGQDQDLWLRIAETGRCEPIPKVLYEAQVSRDSISARRRLEQRKAKKAMLECARARRRGHDDRLLLGNYEQSARNRLANRMQSKSLQHARFYYFVGSTLRHTNPMKAQAYFEKTLRAWILHPRALIRLWQIKRRNTLTSR